MIKDCVCYVVKRDPNDLFSEYPISDRYWHTGKIRVFSLLPTQSDNGDPVIPHMPLNDSDGF